MSVRIIARIRPVSKSELDKDVVVQAGCSHGESQPTIVRMPNPRNEGEEFSFQFNSVYDSAATQQDIFDGEGMSSFNNGFNQPRLTCLQSLRPSSTSLPAST